MKKILLILFLIGSATMFSSCVLVRSKAPYYEPWYYPYYGPYFYHPHHGFVYKFHGRGSHR